MLGQVNTLWRPNVPQLYVDVDREKAKALGVSLDEVYNTLSATLGTYYVNDFNKYGRTWQVLMSAEPEYRKRPDDIGAMYVRSDAAARWCRCRALARGQVLLGPGLAGPLQQPAGGEDVRRGRHRVSARARPSPRSSGSRARSLPPDFTLRLGRRVVPGKALRRHRRRWRSDSRSSWCS